MKKTALLLILLAGLLAPAAPGQTMVDYTTIPPFLGNTVQPNILICLDMTGSMDWRACYTVNGGAYIDTIKYYGYFQPDSFYSYASNTFYSDPAGKFYGNLMNWASMSRVDVARKVLHGGGGVPRVGTKHTLESRGSGTGWGDGNRDTVTVNVAGSITKYRIDRTAVNGVTFTRLSGASPGALSGAYTLKVDVKADWDRGVLQSLADRDLDNNWDADAPRFGLMIYSDSYGQKIEHYIGNTNMESFITAVQNKNPSGGTPIGQAVYEAACYYSQRVAYWPTGGGTKDYSATPLGSNDPQCDKVGGSYPPVTCRRNFALILTDGESNSDDRITTDGSMPPGPFSRDLFNYNNIYEYDDSCKYAGDNDHAGDDYAYYAHITDLRATGYRPVTGMQNVTYYAVNTFGKGSGLMQNIAKWGGFVDRNSDNIPQKSEWDANNDDVPDNFFASEDGYQFETAIRQAITSMIEKAQSASALAITSGTGNGEGTVYQAFFQPKMTLSSGQETWWTGYIRSLFLDKYGNLREDSDENGYLHMRDDYVIQTDTSGTIHLKMDQDGKGGVAPGLPLVEVAPVVTKDLKDVWNGGEWLWTVSPSDRTMFTYINSTKRNFDNGNLTLDTLIGYGSSTAAESIIQYIRGDDMPGSGFRPRNIDETEGIWKLGDIIYSSPSFMGRPTERYNSLYGDDSYNQFYLADSSRRNLVFVGANDGMLHAFNAGRFMGLNEGDTVGYLDWMGHDPGAEEWAYVPYNLLPHLKWLKDPHYTHNTYVDLKAKVTDAKIFTPDGTHHQGWGTVLVGGMRLGGGRIRNPRTSSDTLKSAYFCLDLTNPTSPQVLWEFTDNDLGFTTSYPCVAKVKNRWYVMFGSGPGKWPTAGYDGNSNRVPYLYVLDLMTGKVARKFRLANDNLMAVGDIATIDLNLDYSTDVGYFGTYAADSVQDGKLRRILFREFPGTPGSETVDSTKWRVDTLCSTERQVTAPPAITKDDFNRIWVYFGSGRYFTNADESDTVRQRFWGIRDSAFATYASGLSPTNLLNVTGVAVYNADSVIFNPGNRLMSFQALVDTVNKFKGWYRDLPINTVGGWTSAERVLTRPVVAGGAVVFTTFYPEADVCSQGGQGFVYGVYYLTGTAHFVKLFQGVNEGAASGVATGDKPLKLRIGKGMPSAPTITVTKGGAGGSQVRAVVQDANGAPVTIGINLPFIPQSGQVLWKRE